MHHQRVVDSQWSDEAVFAACAGQIVRCSPAVIPLVFGSSMTPVFQRRREHSVGVARQYCGQLGKTENCQVAVSLSLCTERGSFPWAAGCICLENGPRTQSDACASGSPRRSSLQPKGEIALAHIEAARAAGHPGRVCSPMRPRGMKRASATDSPSGTCATWWVQEGTTVW